MTKKSSVTKLTAVAKRSMFIRVLKTEYRQLVQDNKDMDSCYSFYRCSNCARLSVEGYICSSCGKDPSV